MGLLWQFCTAFTLSILLMMLSVPVGAGTYDAEMVKMATAITASFDQRQRVKTIAVLDFTDLQGTVTELGKFLAEELSSDLVMGQKQFDVIDRANLKRLLDENKLSRSGLVDPETIKRLGKMAGADALVTGTVTPLGNSLRVSAKIIHTETARIVGAAQANIDKTPEISELLRARVVENGGSGTVATPFIPKDNVRAVQNQLPTNDVVQRGRIGIRPIGDESSAPVVGLIEKGGPAEKAGLQVGDIITKYDGKRVANNSDITRMVGDTRPGTKVNIEVSRRGQIKDLSVVVGPLPEAPANMGELSKASARKIKLAYEDKLFRATVASAFFDKSSNQVTLFIDFVNLSEKNEVCLAAASSDSMFAIDDSSVQWNVVGMVGIQRGEAEAPYSRFEDITAYRADYARTASTWKRIGRGASYRFGIVLAPSKPDSPLTLNVTLGLLVGSFPNYGLTELCNASRDLRQASLGFDGIVATK